MVKCKQTFNVILVICLLLTSLMHQSSHNVNKLGAVCFNLNGLTSSTPYLRYLLDTNHIVGVCEHWLSGPELFVLDNICQSHNVTHTCHNELIYAPPERGRGYGGVALFWHKSLNLSTIQGISGGDIVAAKGTIGNLPIAFIMVYLPSGDNNHASYNDVLFRIEEIINNLDDNCNVVLMGDFNANPEADGVLSGNLRNFISGIPLICMDMLRDSASSRYTFHKDGIGCSWIDHVLISPALTDFVISCDVIEEHELNVSDHLPVQVCFDTPSLVQYTESKGKHRHAQYRVKWHKLNAVDISEGYTMRTEEEFFKLRNEISNSVLNLTDIDNLTKRITDILHSAASKFVPRTSNKSRCRPFWTSALSVLVKKKKAAYSEWVAAGRPRDNANINYIRHKEAKNEFKRQYRKEQAIFKAGIESAIEDCSELDQKQFWFLLRKGKKQSKYGSVLKQLDGSVITDESKVSDLWYDHFKDLAQVDNSNQYDQCFKARVDKEILAYESSNEEMVGCENVLNDPVSAEEVEKICSKLKCGKAQDPSGLQGEHFKYGGPSMFITLAVLFNSIIRLEKFPHVFKESITIPLYKGGNKCKMDRNNYRGITIQSIVCKILVPL